MHRLVMRRVHGADSNEHQGFQAISGDATGLEWRAVARGGGIGVGPQLPAGQADRAAVSNSRTEGTGPRQCGPAIESRAPGGGASASGGADYGAFQRDGAGARAAVWADARRGTL